ncbi:MAG: hypothetical protein CVT64_11415 [Actinobacteria bacterium HGW-Actinobacteria-4]|nr:MAG: hypothetical protein CVT64_11415 [Actinobacteria bacterium HGW-Actinobacteria-4]
MRILIVTDLYWPHISGVSRATSQLASRMKQRGHEVGLVVPRTGPALSPHSMEGIEIFHVRALRVKLVGQNVHFGIPMPRAMSGILRKFNPDIVHVQTPMTIGHAISRATARHTSRLVVTNHSLPEITLKNIGGKRGLPSSLRSAVLRGTVSLDKMADVVVVPSDSAIQELYGRKAFRGKDLLAISNGVDTELFSPRPSDLGDANEAANPSIGREPTILFVGRVDLDKDLATLIRAVALVAREQPVKLRIAGNGKHMGEVKKLVAQLGLTDRVHFTGWLGQADLLEELRDATVFCLPSVYETQSIATLEAMAVGLPVVVSDGGAVKDLCSDGVNGFVCEGGSAESFARALGEICASPELAARMGEKSRTFALAHSVSVPIAAHEDLYRSLLRGNGVPDPLVKFSSTADEVLGQAS